MDKVSFHLIGTNGFHAKADNEKFTAARSRRRLQNRKFENFTLSFSRLRQRNNARVAGSFFLIQPIISLLCCIAI